MYQIVKGEKLGPNHLIDTINFMADNLPLGFSLIRLLRHFGAPISENLRSASTPTRKALEQELVQYSVDPKAVAEFEERQQGLLELVVRAGHLPSYDQLNAFFKRPRNRFVRLLLEESPLSMENGALQKLLHLALLSRSYTVALECIDRGAQVTAEHCLIAERTLTENDAASLRRFYAAATTSP